MQAVEFVRGMSTAAITALVMLCICIHTNPYLGQGGIINEYFLLFYFVLALLAGVFIMRSAVTCDGNHLI